MSELTAVLEPALSAVGELLAAEDTEVALVVVGGATLNLLGLLDRTTRDVDVIALAANPIGGVPALLSPRVHAQDLKALDPSDEELEDASAWVVTQDASEAFPRLVSEVVEHVRSYRRNR